MQSTLASAPADGLLRSNSQVSSKTALHEVLEHAGHLLPDQSPLAMFVHHNTLHAFQHLPFHEALRAGHLRYQARVYRAEGVFRRDLKEGRIDRKSLDLEIQRHARRRGLDLDEQLGGLCTRGTLHTLALTEDLAPPTRAVLRWRVREEHFDRRLAAMSPAEAATTIARGRAYLEAIVAEASSEQLARRFLGPNPVPERMHERYAIALDRVEILRMLGESPEPLVAGSMWQTCRALARKLPRARRAGEVGPRPLHRDLIRSRVGVDIGREVDPELLRWAAAYLDEGLAYWPMPERARGFYFGVSELVTEARLGIEAWQRRFVRLLADQRAREVTAEQACLEAFAAFGVEAEEIAEYLLALLFATPGFAGMFSRLERHPHERDPHAPPTSLLDYCAVRLTLEQAALEQAAADHRLGSLSDLERERPAPVRLHPDAGVACRLFVLAQKLELGPAELDALAPDDAACVLAALDDFDELERGQVFLEAYERHYREQILAGMRAIRPEDPSARPSRPSAQYVTCIDDREESFRRHIEEVDAAAETFGAAGSFGLAIDYRGFDAGGHTPLAPAGVRPRHEIVEQPRPGDSMIGVSRQSLRRRWGRVLHQAFFGSRSAVRGALASLLVGPLAWVPMSVRVMAPRSSMRVLGGLGELALPRPRTHLVNAESGERSDRGLARGYTFDEQVDRVYALLEGMGLRDGFAPLVVLLAHGSTSLNNPHEAAHDCGACGGHPGGATARLLASFANDPRVRAKVAERGIAIPMDTWFVAGEHDTADDRVELYDLDAVPTSHAESLARAVEVLDRARARNGHERARKFEMAGLSVGIAEGLRHVEGRASHLAEPRPEYGHCTNAICIVGRRSLTRGLFLDRRAFLVSHDPEADPEGTVLERSLAVAGPVGAGICLEYYFSIVDPERFGCGTKLPHNICGYLGVLNGSSGDLQTGLPLQMIEIHEPMRLLVIVEATPQTLLEIAGRQPVVAELVQNGWIQLVSVDPRSGAMQWLDGESFVPVEGPIPPLPSAPSSGAYYANTRDFLPPARIEAAFGSPR